MIMLVHEYTYHPDPKALDTELLPTSWYIESDGMMWREESYIGDMPSSGGPDTFDEIQKELEELYALGVRGYLVFADDIEHSVFEIRFGEKKMFKDYLSYAPQGKNNGPAELPVDVFESIHTTDIELPPDDMGKVMLVLELNAARLNSELKAYGIKWEVDYIAGNAMRLTSNDAKPDNRSHRAVQLVLSAIQEGDK